MSALNELRKDERSALRAYEATISEGLAGIIRVGNALTVIRDERLYRSTHDTFESYCEAGWKLGRQRAYALIDTATTAAQMSEISDTPPVIESHAAELFKVPQEKRAAVWEKTVESAPRTTDGRPKVTASLVRAVAERESEPTTRASLRPSAKHVPSGDVSTPPENLTRLIRNLREAIECEPTAAPYALQRLQSEAARGLYSPATSDPHQAFVSLGDLVADLMERLQ